MKRNFILSLLLLFICYVFGKIANIFPAVYSLWITFVLTFVRWILIGVFFGAIYTSIYKIKIPKSDKIKIILYFLCILIILFFVSTIILKILSLKTLPVLFINIISTWFTYLGIDPGCKLTLIILNKCKSIRQRK